MMINPPTRVPSDFTQKLAEEERRSVAAGRFSGFPGVVENRAGDELEAQLKGEVRTSAPVNIRDMNSDTAKAMLSMAKEYRERTGNKLVLNDGFRTFAEQVDVRMRKGEGMTALPGTSEHGYGSAFDVNSTQVSELKELGLLNKYGFKLTATGEGWHIARPQDTKAAKADERYKALADSGSIVPDNVRAFLSSASDKVSKGVSDAFSSVSNTFSRGASTAYSFVSGSVKRATNAVASLNSGDASSVADKSLNMYKQLNAELEIICKRVGAVDTEAAWLDRIRAEGTNTPMIMG